jgi:hypothetical protein
MGVNMGKCNKDNCKNCNCKESQSMGETRFEFWGGLERYINNPGVVATGYSLTLTDPGTKEGYKISFSTEISIFDFFNIFQEYFNNKNLEVDIVSDEED